MDVPPREWFEWFAIGGEQEREAEQVDRLVLFGEFLADGGAVIEDKLARALDRFADVLRAADELRAMAGKERGGAERLEACFSIERALAHIPDIFERVFGSPEHAL